MKSQPPNPRGVALCEGRKEYIGDVALVYRVTAGGPRGFSYLIPFPLSSGWPRIHTLGEIFFQSLVKFTDYNLEIELWLLP